MYLLDHRCNLQKRSDDTENIIKKRMQTYNRNTEPIIKFFEDENKVLHTFNVQKVNTYRKNYTALIFL